MKIVFSTLNELRNITKEELNILASEDKLILLLTKEQKVISFDLCDKLLNLSIKIELKQLNTNENTNEYYFSCGIIANEYLKENENQVFILNNNNFKREISTNVFFIKNLKQIIDKRKEKKESKKDILKDNIEVKENKQVRKKGRPVGSKNKTNEKRIELLKTILTPVSTNDLDLNEQASVIYSSVKYANKNKVSLEESLQKNIISESLCSNIVTAIKPIENEIMSIIS